MDVPELGKLALNGEINEVKDVVERERDAWKCEVASLAIVIGEAGKCVVC
jgi:hypothetical protein